MIKNLIGQTFGRLTVIEQLPSKNKRAYWRCQCSCGNLSELSSKHLISGGTKSCGCFRSDVISKLRQSEAIPFEDRLLLMPSGCIEWQGSRDKNGYGTFRSGKRDHKAHRFAYEKAFGIIPKGIIICHTCDNPPCCNPDHLFAGTNKDNMNDMVSKGRSLIGSKNHNSKVNEHTVKRIRELYSEGITQQKISNIFGIAQTTVSVIILNKGWKHVK